MKWVSIPGKFLAFTNYLRSFSNSDGAIPNSAPRDSIHSGATEFRSRDHRFTLLFETLWGCRNFGSSDFNESMHHRTLQSIRGSGRIYSIKLHRSGKQIRECTGFSVEEIQGMEGTKQSQAWTEFALLRTIQWRTTHVSAIWRRKNFPFQNPVFDSRLLVDVQHRRRRHGVPAWSYVSFDPCGKIFVYLLFLGSTQQSLYSPNFLPFLIVVQIQRWIRGFRATPWLRSRWILCFPRLHHFLNDPSPPRGPP